MHRKRAETVREVVPHAVAPHVLGQALGIPEHDLVGDILSYLYIIRLNRRLVCPFFTFFESSRRQREFIQL